MSVELRVHSGRSVDLLFPHPYMICWDDISRSLYAQERYLGHLHLEGQIVDRWSVAHHSLLVADVYLEMFRQQFSSPPCAEDSMGTKFMLLVCLLHDAAEAYIGDINWVLKQSSPQIKEEVERIQTELLKAIFSRLLMEIEGIWPFPNQSIPKHINKNAESVLKIYRDLVKMCDVVAREMEMQLLDRNYIERPELSEEDRQHTYRFVRLLSDLPHVTGRTIGVAVRNLISDLRSGGFEFDKHYPGSSFK